MASKYSEELKATAVRQVSVEGRPLKQVADAAGVTPATLRRWIKAVAADLPDASPAGVPASDPAAPLRLVLLDGVDTGAKLERILHNEGFQPETQRLQNHALAQGLPETEWLASACVFSLSDAGARRLINLIERSGKDTPIAWLGSPAAWIATGIATIDYEWVPEATPQLVQHVLGRLHERRRLRTQLRECQRHFEHLQRCCLRAFDEASNPIAIVRPQGHIYANAAYMRLFGYAEFAALQAQPPGGLWAPDDAPALGAAFTLQDHEQIVLDLVTASGQRARAELERFPGSSNGVQLTVLACEPPAVERPRPQIQAQPVLPDEPPAVDEALAEWAERIAQALKEDDRFSIVYQPIVSLFGGVEASYEALLRLHDEQGSEYLPGVFLPVARQAGLMGVVDQWAIRRVAMQVKSELGAGRPLRIFVNLARESLLSDDFQHWLARLIDYLQIPAATLVFEIPQSVPMLHLHECRAVVAALRALGCGIVLDSFDGGEEAFALVGELAVDCVKFDLARIRLLSDAGDAQDCIRRIVTRVHALGPQVIASRVQDAPSVAQLWQCGADYVQGYFLQQPSQVLDYDFISSECEVTEKRGQNPFSIG